MLQMSNVVHSFACLSFTGGEVLDQEEGVLTDRRFSCAINHNVLSVTNSCKILHFKCGFNFLLHLR